MNTRVGTPGRICNDASVIGGSGGSEEPCFATGPKLIVDHRQSAGYSYPYLPRSLTTFLDATILAHPGYRCLWPKCFSIRGPRSMAMSFQGTIVLNHLTMLPYNEVNHTYDLHSAPPCCALHPLTPRTHTHHLRLRRRGGGPSQRYMCGRSLNYSMFPRDRLVPPQVMSYASRNLKSSILPRPP